MSLITYFDVSIVLIFVLIWIGIVTYLRLKKKKNYVYLTFFTIFYIYVFKVLDYTLFQFQSLILLKYFIPNLILNGQAAGEELNLIPLVTLTAQDLETSFLNILLMVPFGFGLPFITDFRLKKTVILGALFSIAIEVLQLVTGLLARTTFRVADVNDVTFNTLGTAVGSTLFIGFLRIFREMSHNWKVSHTVMKYIIERSQI